MGYDSIYSGIKQHGTYIVRKSTFIEVRKFSSLVSMEPTLKKILLLKNLKI